MIQFENMSQLLEERSQGIAKLEKYTAEGFFAMREGITPGEYIRLIVNDELMMSNTSMEKRTSSEFLSKAWGNVLICGLGIGLVLLPLLKNPNVESITVVEKYRDVIDIVLPQIKKYDVEDKLTVVNQDCFEFSVDIPQFDSIFIDIWPNINEDIYKEEMKPLKQKYRKFLTPLGKQEKNIFVWAEDYAKNGWRLY